MGILRRGAKSGKHNSYQDVPPGMFMGEGYDAQKDLVYKEEVQAAAQAVMGGGGRLVAAPRPPLSSLSQG